MLTQNRLNNVFHSAKIIPYNHDSRIIIMSDCHRGNGSGADNFLKNQNLFFAALSYYYEHHFTYIELGDGDELWENRSYKEIADTHSDIFWLLSKFYKKCRFHMIFGNHDMEKKYRSCIPSFPSIEIYEGIILKNKNSNCDIFLTHGHQGDWLNDYLWKLARFLVRYLWRPLELIGFQDPTSAAKNYEIKESVELRLKNWALKNHQIIVAGHTHRPIFPNNNEPPYFNDGSCVHPRCITGIEIWESQILLVKWCVQPKPDNSLSIVREILAGPKKISNFAQSNTKSRINK